MPQYLLTQEEYDALVCADERAKKAVRETLISLCRDVCNHKPQVDWRGDIPQPWGCIQDHEGWYCDQCPVQAACPFTGKRYSK